MCLIPSSGPDVSQPVLEVLNLQTEFNSRSGTVRATRDVSISVAAGEVLGLVGESGSGKSVLLRSILRMPPKPGRITSGEVLFKGVDILRLPPSQMREIRGGQIALIPQDPINSFNPSLTLG